MKERTTRWYVQPFGKARTAVEQVNEQNPEKYADSVKVRYPDGVREVRGVWEVSYTFMEELRRDPEMRFNAFSQEGNYLRRPWYFPLDKKKKLARKVKAAIGRRKKPSIGSAKKI